MSNQNKEDYKNITHVDIEGDVKIQPETKYILIILFVAFIIEIPHILIGSASQDMASKFKKDGKNAAFQMCLSLFGGVVRILNSKYLLHYKHYSKMMTTAIAYSLGFLFLFFSYTLGDMEYFQTGFLFSLIGTIIIGFFNILADGTMIGFMKAFHPYYFSGFSAGTGISGVTAPGLYLIFKMIGLEIDWICILLIPLTFYSVYQFGKFRDWLNQVGAEGRNKEVELVDSLHKEKELLQKIQDNEKSKIKGIQKTLKDAANGSQGEFQAMRKAEETLHTRKKSSLKTAVEIPTKEKIEADINQELGLAAWNRTKHYVGETIIINGIVYFLEYSCFTSFAERANQKRFIKPEDGFLVRYAFILLIWAYRTGVCIGRSSIRWAEFRKVRILVGLQLLNFTIYSTIAYWRWLWIGFQIPLMVWVGVISGTCYSNCYNLILTHDELGKDNKEVAVNLNGLATDSGIFTASVFSLFISRYVIQF